MCWWCESEYYLCVVFVTVLCFCWGFVSVCVCSAGLDFLKIILFVYVNTISPL